MNDDVTRRAKALKAKLEREIKDEFLIYLQDCKEAIELEDLQSETVTTLRSAVMNLKKALAKGPSVL